MKDKINEDLRRWFKEKWVDISKKDASGNHPPCGRSKSKKKGYPKCRPSKRVSSDTPQTSGEMSQEDKKKAVSQKRRAEAKGRKGKKPNVVSHLKEELLTEKNKPTNSKLWSRAKSLARKKFKVYPSAYANAWAAKWYKKHGGGWNSVNEASFASTMLGAGILGASLGLLGAAHKRSQAEQPPEQPTMVQHAEPKQEKPKVVVKPKTVAQPKAEEKTYHHDAIHKMVKQDEGLRLKAYKDTKGLATVGYGHNLTTSGSSNSFKQAFGERGDEIRGHVLRGGSLTTEQADALFHADYDEHLQRTIKLVPNLHEHPPEVQAALVSGVYRGHVSGSPKFLKKFNAGDYHGAAAEFIDSKEYRNPKTPKGVLNRLNRDHQIFVNYAASQK